MFALKLCYFNEGRGMKCSFLLFFLGFLYFFPLLTILLGRSAPLPSPAPQDPAPEILCPFPLAVPPYSRQMSRLRVPEKPYLITYISSESVLQKYLQAAQTVMPVASTREHPLDYPI